MKKKTILALGTLLPAEMDELEKHYDLIRLWKEADPETALQTHKNDIVAIISSYSGMPVTRRILEALPNVSMIGHFGMGVDTVDLAAVRERHIALTNTPGILAPDTADIALSLMLTVSRRIVEADMYVRVGKWPSGAFPLATSMTGKRVGIVGMGRIGQAIARRCTGFDMTISYHGPREKAGMPYQYYADLRQMAEHSDFLVLACPGGPDTHHIVNAKVLKSLGAKGYVINVARGTVIDTDDLLVALSNREIAGAGLDVYETEPNIPDALISMDNVVLLPHIGSATTETRAAMGRLVISNIVAHFDGQPLLTPVPM